MIAIQSNIFKDNILKILINCVYINFQYTASENVRVNEVFLKKCYLLTSIDPRKLAQYVCFASSYE